MKNQSNGQGSSIHLTSLAHGRAINPVKALQRVRPHSYPAWSPHTAGAEDDAGPAASRCALPPCPCLTFDPLLWGLVQPGWQSLWSLPVTKELFLLLALTSVWALRVLLINLVPPPAAGLSPVPSNPKDFSSERCSCLFHSRETAELWSCWGSGRWGWL